MANPNFMNGIPELVILRLLEKREMYGYELVQAIRRETNNAISLGEGVVYPALHMLEHQRALKARRKTVNGRTRIYYAVTKSGKKRLVGLTADWSRVTGAVSHVLSGDRHVLANV